MLNKGRGVESPPAGVRGITAQAVLDSLSGHIAVLDKSGTIVALNSAWRKFGAAGRPGGAFRTGRGENYLEALSPSPPGRGKSVRIRNRLRAVLTGDIGKFSIEYAVGSGVKKRWYRLSACPVVADGAVTGAVLTRSDVTQLKNSVLEARRLSVTDPMTGIPNRKAALGLLGRKIRHCGKKGLGLTVCYADIDNLKRINDNFGHREGDRVIKAAVRLIKSRLAASDTVCRMGGDELLIVLPGSTAADAEHVLERIRGLVRRVNDKKVLPAGIRLSFSYGLAEYSPESGLTAGELVHMADRRMYGMKSALKGGRKKPGRAARTGPGASPVVRNNTNFY